MVETIDETGFILNGTYSNAGNRGFSVLMKRNCTLKKITKVANNTATKAYVISDDKATILAEALFSGQEAVFDLELLDATTYYFITGSDGASHQKAYTSGGSYPYVLSAFNILEFWGDDGTLPLWRHGNDEEYNIYSVTTEVAEVTTTTTAKIGGGWIEESEKKEVQTITPPLLSTEERRQKELERKAFLLDTNIKWGNS